MSHRLAALPATVLAITVAACMPPSRVAEPPRPRAAPPLPPVPMVRGPVVLRVRYPSSNAVVNARDSTFIFGTLGTGEGTLRIDGAPVTVHPNGAFLAWLPVPAAPRYLLEAVRGTDTTRLVHPVRLLPPRVAPADSGALVVDSASAAPRGADRVLPADEGVRVSVRAPRNADVWLQAIDGRRVSLVNGGTVTRGARDTRDDYLWAREVPAGALAGASRVMVARGADTVTLPLATFDTLAGTAAARAGDERWVVLGGDSSAISDTDRVVVGRPVAGGTYKWFFLPGTMVAVTGAAGDQVRVRLDESLDVWVDAAAARTPTAGPLGARRVTGNLRIVPDSGWVDVVIPIGDRPPFSVDVEDRRLRLTLHGTVANIDIVNFAGADTLVRWLRWEQPTRDRARLVVELSSAPYGWLALWRGSSLVLRVRRPPVPDARRPLAGLVIAVDPGHPPIGATGPTGYYEGEASLAIGQRLRALLEARGARVFMTRTTMEPVALGERPIAARRAGAHAFVSIHLNALPDGVNPFTANGTGTYFFQPQSAPLARAVQAGMVREMGLRDHGTFYDNLAVVRTSWMPSVLCEGAFLMIPEQEAALRTPAFQERYARGVADGLEAYFRGLAR